MNDLPVNRRRQEILRRLIQKANGRCVYCKRQVVITKGHGLSVKATIDHVIPRSKKGTNKLNNLVLACAFCNQIRGHMDVREYSILVAVALRFGVPMEMGPRCGSKFLTAVNKIIKQQRSEL